MIEIKREFNEITTEATISKDGTVKDVKSKIKYGRCEPCIEGKHNLCKRLNCGCAHNSHQR